MVKVGDIVTIKSEKGLENHKERRRVYLNDDMRVYAGKTAKVVETDGSDDTFMLENVVDQHSGYQWSWDKTMIKKQKFFVKIGDERFVNLRTVEDELFIADDKVMSRVDTQFKLKKAKKIKKRFLEENDGFDKNELKIVPVLTDADITVF